MKKAYKRHINTTKDYLEVKNNNLISRNLVTKSINQSIAVKKSLLKENIDDILYAKELCVNTLKNKGKIILCGNGGSASDAHHLATELLVRLRPKVNRKPIAALSLNLDTTSISACSNDYNYNIYLSRMLEALGKKEDILIAISTSGNSINILNVLKKSKKLGIKSISLLGNKGGNAKKLSNHNIIVNSKTTARIQEAHICIGHILMELIEDDIR